MKIGCLTSSSATPPAACTTQPLRSGTEAEDEPAPRQLGEVAGLGGEHERAAVDGVGDAAAEGDGRSAIAASDAMAEWS